MLARPFALYDVAKDANGEPVAIDVVYLIVGRGTAELVRRRSGDVLDVWGPLGNGFAEPPKGSVVFVAGGIGQTPFLALGKWWLGSTSYGVDKISFKHSAVSDATMLYGVRSRDLLAGVEDFRAAGIEVEIATDDGGAGRRGFVTQLLHERFKRGERPAKVVGCGPPMMLQALSRLVEQYQIPCDLSLENHMACGFGACFSCVAPIKQSDGSIDLRRVCVEGPIFPCELVSWPESPNSSA